MTEETFQAVGVAEQAVSRLVEACRKGGPLYARAPRVVAQVSRTSKWLLNALARLRHELGTGADNAALSPSRPQQQQAAGAASSRRPRPSSFTLLTAAQSA